MSTRTVAFLGLAISSVLAAQDGLDALRNADWRERTRIAMRLIEDADFDPLGLVPALVPEAEWTAATGLRGALPYPGRVLDLRRRYPPSRRELPRHEPLLRSSQDLVIAMSPSEAALQILALRHAEQRDDVHDALMAMLVEHPRTGLFELVARRPERTLAWLRANPTASGKQRDQARLLDGLGELGQTELRRWLLEPALAPQAIPRLDPRPWSREEAARILALLHLDDQLDGSNVIRLFEGEQDPAVMAMVDAALDPFLDGEEPERRAKAAAAFAGLDLAPRDARARLATFGRMLQAKSPDERGCAAAALASLAPRIAFDRELVATLFDLANARVAQRQEAEHEARAAAQRTLRGLGAHLTQHGVMAEFDRELRERIATADDQITRRSTIKAMSRLGPLAISPDSVDALTSLVESGEEVTSSLAVHTLMHCGPGASSALLAIVREHESYEPGPGRRHSALAAWAISPDFARDEILGDALGGRMGPGRRTDPKDEHALAEALGVGMDFDEHANAVVRLLGDPRELARRAAIRTLLAHPCRDPEVLQFLPTLVADPDPTLRDLALDLLWQQKLLGADLRPLSAPLCQELAERETAADVRAALALAALWTGEIQTGALEPLLGAISGLPRAGADYPGERRRAARPIPNPLPLAQSDFLVAIEALPKHPAAIGFLELWMSSEDPKFRRAANLARLRMHGR